MRSTIKVGDTDKTKTTNTPLVASLDATETLSTLKSTRDFQHSRQRAMKTVQVKNWKEEKAWNRHVKLELRKLQPNLPPAPQPTRRPGRGTVGGFRQSERSDRDLDVSTKSDWELSEEEEIVPTWRSQEKIEVDLTHLMRAAKPRKSKTGDFEVIPKVRSVVVLDERLEAGPEIDDPWEYVSADDEDTKRPALSYAEAVTNVQ